MAKPSFWNGYYGGNDPIIIMAWWVPILMVLGLAFAVGLIITFMR